MAMREPTAKLIEEQPGCRRIWTVKWPGKPMRVGGKSYVAITYPESDRVFLETAAKRRPVSPLVARRIMPQVRAALSKAEGH